jgi:hypothetical protein
VLADGQSCARVVRDEPFVYAHSLERSRIRALPQPIALLPQQWPLGFAGSFHLPQCVPPVLDTVKLAY